MRAFAVCALLGVLAWAGTGVGSQKAVPAVRPNILLLVAEDMSPRIRALGDPVAVTPNLDRLAEQGVRFPNTFTTAGVCAPSRAALITGRYQTTIGAHAMRTGSYGKDRPDVVPQGYEAVPPPEVKGFPELLRAAGYATLNSVKTDYQFGDPFTMWDENGFFVAWSDRPQGVPFFAMENFMVTHESGLFPKRFPRDLIEATLRLVHLGYEWRYEEVVSPESVQVPAYYPDTTVVRETLARQYGNIALLDERVGEILDDLESQGLADSTIVVFTSDHGDGLPRAKREVYDSGIRVPLIIRWPPGLQPEGLPPGSVDETLVSFIDIAPQILSWAGVPKPPFMQGHAFLGQQAGASRRLVFAARDRMDEVEDRVRAVRDDQWKYIRNFRPQDPGAKPSAFRDHLDIMNELWERDGKGELEGPATRWFAAPRASEELYFLPNDPEEIVNLAGDPAHHATLIRLRGELDAWLDENPDQGAVEEAALVEQFWPGGVQPQTDSPQHAFESVAGDPVRVRLFSSTPGASIGYRLNGAGRLSDWNLYTGPFEGVVGDEIEARAIRYGYQESETHAFEVP